MSPAARSILIKRRETENQLASLIGLSKAQFSGTVLYDGTFDNPNFWLRSSMLRAALGLAKAREVGLIGPYKRKDVRAAFARLGIQEVHDIASEPSGFHFVRATAKKLLASTAKPGDILSWRLPGAVDPVVIYDSILKRQQRAVVDLDHREMYPLVEEAVGRIQRCIEVLDEVKPDLVVMSHTIGMICGPLAYLAAARGIPVVLVFGLFGALRFARFSTTSELFSFYDRPTREEIDSLPDSKADSMKKIGRAYLAQRLDGKADDLASVYAFQRNQAKVNRSEICAHYGWDPNKPIIAFYASNWFDWPHQLGMTQFRDFLDWTEATFAVARKNPQFNWLFKSHPTEEWFGGVALADILRPMGQQPHIALSDKSWNNTHVMNAVDALVTYHGTAGIEFASLGKPVLVPDRGKYDDCGFVRVASSRADYLSLLATPWWHDMNLDETRRRAEIFAGWWFCAPTWQGRLILADDSRQDALYDVIPELLANNRKEITREIASLRDWWASGHRYYHTWKMMQAESYQLSNV